MATDATGTPTSLGIPTYDINADAPSGNGNTAQMEAIDALIAARATTASPALTGTPTAPTPAPGDNSTKIATTGFVETALAFFAPGIVVPYAGSTAPSGWLLADGSAVSRTTYAALFSVIAETYGAGDGSTTFNLPDMRGRVAVGQNTATFATLGGTGGEESHVLSAGEMPAHDHAFSANTGANSVGHVHGYYEPSLVATVNNTEGVTPYTTRTFYGPSAANTNGESVNHTHAVSGTTASAGSGNSHNNLQPYLVLNHIIKT